MFLSVSVSDNIRHSHPTDVRANLESLNREIIILKYRLELNDKYIQMATRRLEELDSSLSREHIQSGTTYIVQMRDFVILVLVVIATFSAIFAMPPDFTDNISLGLSLGSRAVTRGYSALQEYFSKFA
jgi:hypothetical protein